MQSIVNNQLEKEQKFRENLYARGFLLSNADIDHRLFPFIGSWNMEQIGQVTLYVSPKQRYVTFYGDNATFILVGHAYNPFTKMDNESEILWGLDNHVVNRDFEPLFDAVNELTGVFTLLWIIDGTIYVIGDASGMQTTFYTNNRELFYVSSHTNLLGEILNLKWDPYVERLTQYRFFKLLGNSLPGDLTQFSTVKRLVPNHFISFSNKKWECKRFYWPKSLDISYEEILNRCIEIMQNNVSLISKKWDKPAISMTGGCDSKTTLASAKGLYDKFSYFSYISSESERVDAEAAHKICERLKLKHKVFVIPDHDEDVPCVEETRKILRWNTGNIRDSNPNDVRKRAWFAENWPYDVEVKSWASEIGRAYYSKRFHNRVNFGKKPTPRRCTTLYKFFLHNRKLVKETDRIFSDYLSNYFEQSPDRPLPWQEQFFWEFRVPSWNGLVITGEHRYSFDITIPYNNRKLFELLLSVPLQARIEDRLYKDMRERMNPEIDKTGVFITNVKHTERRAQLEDIYWLLHANIVF